MLICRYILWKLCVIAQLMISNFIPEWTLWVLSKYDKLSLNFWKLDWSPILVSHNSLVISQIQEKLMKQLGISYAWHNSIFATLTAYLFIRTIVPIENMYHKETTDHGAYCGFMIKTIDLAHHLILKKISNKEKYFMSKWIENHKNSRMKSNE